MRNELIGDVGDVITGFLKNNRMEPSTGRRNDIGGVSVRWAWVPRKNRETVLMMHEVTVRSLNVTEPVGFGLVKFDHGENQDPRFWKRSTSRPHEGLHRWHGGFPPGWHLHSFCGKLGCSDKDSM